MVWSGPPAYLFCPAGWRVERRRAKRPDVNSDCDALDAAALARLRGSGELAAGHGGWTWREGRWPDGTKSEIVTLEFDAERSGVHGQVDAVSAFVVGLRGGKVVRFAGPLTGGFDLGTGPLDRVVVYAIAPTRVVVCVRRDDAVEWTSATVVRKLLRLPLQEFMPELATPQDEFAEAKRRLLPGDQLSQDRFADFARLLRLALRDESPPIRRTVLMRDDIAEPFEELCALDSLRMVYADPMWRRVLGLAIFDDDPALVPGERYDYRLSGVFPAAGVQPRYYGFHTVPSPTALPAEFYLYDCLVRTAQPLVVRRDPGVDESGDLAVSRRCVLLGPREQPAWFGIGIEDASAVLDFGAPVASLVLDIAPGHALRYQAGDPWTVLTPPAPVPPGPQAVLQFAAPVTQLRLFGAGALFGFSIPVTEDGTVTLAATVLGVRLADAPRPDPPTWAAADNLQTGAAAVAPAVPARHQLGMRVRWQPAESTAVPLWPPGDELAVPLEATTFQLERRVDPGGPWRPVLGGHNRILGGADDAAPPAELRPGADLMRVFPEVAPPAGTDPEMSYRDTFLAATPEDRAALVPGAFLRYRVRAVDVVGRPGPAWTETAPVRLEKHEPPPVPAAPDEVPADALDGPAPTGIRARAIVAGDPALTPADRALLGDSANAVVLSWGWHAQQRAQDPLARQFRVYLAYPLDGVDGRLVAATPGAPGTFSAALELARPVAADAAKGLYLDAGTPFYVEGHTAGTNVQATLRTRIPLPDGSFRVPQAGPVRLPLRFSSGLTRPAGWAERVEVSPGQQYLPITDATAYELVLRDRLLLTDDHPRDEIWLGVSAADTEPYVADTFGGAVPLPGNEGSVALVGCQAALMSYPSYTPPHALAPVPRIRAPEPVNGEVRCVVDLAPYLTGMGLTGGDAIRPERLAAEDLLTALAVRTGRLFATVVDRRDPGEADQELVLPNPADQAALVAAIADADIDRVQDRFLTYLAGVHPYADRLFRAVTTGPVPFAAFTDAVPPGGRRYVYRVRKAGPLGRLSRAAAVAKVVLRVPSLRPGPPPAREPRRPGDGAATLRLSLPTDARLRSVLVFERAAAAGTALDRADVIRLPNRADLAPPEAIRLRAADGSITAPTVVDVEPGPGGTAQFATASLTPHPGRRAAVWACSLTDDGIPSALAGPWIVHFPPS